MKHKTAFLLGIILSFRGVLPAQITTGVGLPTASPAAPRLGDLVTLTAEVLPTSFGSVLFMDGGIPIGTGAIKSGGLAQMSTAMLAAGPHALRAVYGGSGVYRPSQSAALAYVVTAVPGEGFASAANYPSGTGPYSVAVSDFNGDGKADLVTPNFGGNNVSILLGNGDGTFRAPVNYATSGGPFWVAVADLNGDGRIDLAVANSTGVVSVLLGNGDGTFQAAVNYPAGSGSNYVAVGDFNSDGNVDLAVSNPRDNDVSVLLGNGDGSFRPAVNYAAGSGPVSVAVGDFDGNGAFDLAVANSGSNNVSLLLGNGNGTFQAPVNFPAGTNPLLIVAADFNGDGIADMAAANSGSNTISVLLSVLLDNGDETFQAAVNYPVVGLGPGSIAVSDFNGDGKADLVVGNLSSPNGSVLFGNGDGTFQPAASYSANSTRAVAAGDFNGDGRADLAEVNSGVSVLLATAPASTTTTLLSSLNPSTFAQPVTLTATVTPLNATGEVTFLDGITLLGTGALNQSGIATISTRLLPSGDRSLRAEYDGGAGFQSSQSAALTQTVNPVAAFGFQWPLLTAAGNMGPKVVASADFNGDGKADLLTGQINSVESVLLGNDDGTFQAPMNTVTETLSSIAGVGDFNGDGKPDWLIAGPSGIGVFLGNGDGTFHRGADQAVGMNLYPRVVGDFNGDGILDLIAFYSLAPSFSVLLGNGDGSFRVLGSYQGGTNFFTAVVTADFNGDGTADLVLSTSVNNVSSVQMLLGNGDGTFRTGVNIPIGDGFQASDILAGDFNGDGKADLAIAGFTTTYSLNVLLGKGDGTFLSPVSSSAVPVTGMVACDFNGDGNLDLIFAEAEGPGGGSVDVFLGNGNGTFQTVVKYTTFQGPNSLVAADFNGDGRIDVVAGTTGIGSDLNVLLGDGHPAFFSNEVPFANGAYYLQFPDGNLFGYYSSLPQGWIYHFDMGYEHVSPGTGTDVYLFDLASTHTLYTNADLFPYLYDFTLNAWLYYFPDPKNPEHYTSNPRYFANLTAGQIFTM